VSVQRPASTRPTRRTSRLHVSSSPANPFGIRARARAKYPGEYSNLRVTDRPISTKVRDECSLAYHRSDIRQRLVASRLLCRVINPRHCLMGHVARMLRCLIDPSRETFHSASFNFLLMQADGLRTHPFAVYNLLRTDGTSHAATRFPCTSPVVFNARSCLGNSNVYTGCGRVTRSGNADCVRLRLVNYFSPRRKPPS